jgi:predicted metal-dependent peptidase
LVNALLEPKLNWRNLLAKFITKSNGAKRTWDRPNRRFMSRGLYLPSTHGEKIRIAIGIDTSGSVTEYVQRFMSEVDGLIKSFGEYELTIIQCDTKVQKVNVYSHEEPLDLVHTKFELEGFGGTILKPIFDHVKENRLEVDCIAVLTDGCLADKFTLQDSPEIPVLWCVTKGGSKTGLAFGEIADIDD